MPRTPELVPRRQGAGTFAQIAAAVLSGAAAMYGIQSYTAPASGQKPAEQAPARRQPALSEPLPVPPPPVLAKSSMLVKKEPGGAPQGVLAGGIDDPERRAGSRSGPERLTLRSEGIGRSFDRMRFSPMAPVGGVAPTGKRSTRLLDKTPLDQKDILTPSDFRPEDAPEPVFWTEERVERVAGSGLVALIGLSYLFFTSGAFAALRGKGRPREEEEGTA